MASNENLNIYEYGGGAEVIEHVKQYIFPPVIEIFQKCQEFHCLKCKRHLLQHSLKKAALPRRTAFILK